jgi:hypothetical protein
LSGEKLTYTAYYRTLEASRIKISDNLDELKKEWCFGMVIFETPGLTYEQLKNKFPDPPEIGVVLKWLRDMYEEVHKSGSLVDEE